MRNYLLSVFLFGSFVFPLSAGIQYVMPVKQGDGSGSSWANSANILDAFAGLTSDSELWVASGNYTPGVLRSDNLSISGLDNVQIFGGFSGNGTEVSVDGKNWLHHETVLTGDIGTPSVDTDNSYNVLVLHNSTNVIIDGVTVRDGHASGGWLLCYWRWYVCK